MLPFFHIFSKKKERKGRTLSWHDSSEKALMIKLKTAFPPSQHHWSHKNNSPYAIRQAPAWPISALILKLFNILINAATALITISFSGSIQYWKEIVMKISQVKQQGCKYLKRNMWKNLTPSNSYIWKNRITFNYKFQYGKSMEKRQLLMQKEQRF